MPRRRGGPSLCDGYFFVVCLGRAVTVVLLGMTARYQDVLDELRASYDGAAETRDQREKAPWKVVERAAFLDRLRTVGYVRLLEIGAGTGQDSVFFRDHGLRVTATDLSPVMVASCRAKGLDARVMDFLHLDFEPASFDAVYALNCLLHVPNADLPAVLEQIRMVLRPGGLFFLGVYGGDGSEGVAEWDEQDPPRFFSWRTDEQILQFVDPWFKIVEFHVVGEGTTRFQSLTLSPSDAG
jgi:SAM-dependent methyltransferase